MILLMVLDIGHAPCVTLGLSEGLGIVVARYVPFFAKALRCSPSTPKSCRVLGRK